MKYRILTLLFMLALFDSLSAQPPVGDPPVDRPELQTQIDVATQVVAGDVSSLEVAPGVEDLLMSVDESGEPVYLDRHRRTDAVVVRSDQPGGESSYSTNAQSKHGPLAYYQVPGDPPVIDPGDGSGPVTETGGFINDLWQWLLTNGLSVLLPLLALIEVVVRLTPTEKDNAWFRWVMNLVNTIFPNRKKGGGTFAQ